VDLEERVTLLYLKGMSLRIACSLFAILLGGCAAPTPYEYRFAPGKTATLRDGHAIAPLGAPDEVFSAIDAANRIAGLPYARGGGHGRGMSRSYDCSGATSYVLHAAGLLQSAMPSKSFRNYGERGDGKWISIYARRDHVFLVVAGLRFDTGWANGPRGPRWTTRRRPMNGAVIRHPRGL
jgi:hypothetical protein